MCEKGDDAPKRHYDAWTPNDETLEEASAHLRRRLPKVIQVDAGADGVFKVFKGKGAKAFTGEEVRGKQNGFSPETDKRWEPLANGLYQAICELSEEDFKAFYIGSRNISIDIPLAEAPNIGLEPESCPYENEYQEEGYKNRKDWQSAMQMHIGSVLTKQVLNTATRQGQWAAELRRMEPARLWGQARIGRLKFSPLAFSTIASAS